MPPVPEVAARIPRRRLGLLATLLVLCAHQRADASGHLLVEAKPEHLRAPDPWFTLELRGREGLAAVDRDLDRRDGRGARERQAYELLRAEGLLRAVRTRDDRFHRE